MTDQELNKAVAEKVMGYSLYHCKKSGNAFWVDEDNREPDHSQDYCYDWNAMKEVMDKVGGDWDISNTGDKWHVTIDVMRNGLSDFFFEYNETTLPRAVCMAALKSQEL